MAKDEGTMRPRLLDLFCCQGGAAAGYAAAGFDVVGVDVEPQPLYPYEFVQADALTYPLDGFDAVHASPPCHGHSSLAPFATKENQDTWWMLAATIERLEASGLPYVVENVMGARKRMPGAFKLCGRSFGIQRLQRHRLFVTNFAVLAPPCACDGTQPLGIYGDLSKNDRKVRNSKDGIVRMRAGIQSARDLLGCQWMDRHGLSQAIPPAYTEHIGAQLLQHLAVVA